MYIYNGLKWFGASPTVLYKINGNASDCIGERAAVQRAADTWNNAGADFTFQDDGSHNRTSPDQNGKSEIFWGGTSLPDFAVAGVHKWGNVITGQISECDMEFNDRVYTFSTSSLPSFGKFDIESVALHEFGHWLELADLPDYADRNKAMYKSISSGQEKRTLHADDINGILFIYGEGSCSLKVTITPQGAVDAGAKWRRVGTNTWRASRYTETGIPTGSYTVEFRSVSGWTKPANLTKTVNANQTATTSRGYTRLKGSLKVTITPQGAVDAGAKWRRVGHTWRASEYTETGLPTGSYRVEFSSVSGWTKPANQTVTVRENETYTTSGEYTREEPPITVISPNGGENWQRGTSHNITWNSSGNVDAQVKLQLYKGEEFNYTIIHSTSNNGTYTWYIPPTQTIGSDYKIKITSISNSSHNDDSDDNFSISLSMFMDDFESYAAGSEMHGQGEWKGWDNDAAFGAPASDLYAFSGSTSVEIISSADLVHELHLAGGKWTVSAMQYIPSGTTGTTYFILLNQYSDAGSGGPAKDWSVQTTFNLGTGAIGFWHGGSGQILYDQWVELKYIIDLDNNTVDKYYNGELMATDVWDDNDHGTLGCIDLYGNNASSIYYDDITVVIPSAYNPDPADGAIHPDTWASLSWTPGAFAVSHDVYLGDNFDDVNDGVGDTFRSNQAATDFVAGFPGFAYPDGLVQRTTYYWRIDENNADGTLTKGRVWSFTVADFILVDDFESYAAGSEMHGQGGWNGWDNDAGFSAPASDLYAYSGSTSVEIISSADLVHEFDISGGRWKVSAMQYIPSGTTGESYFILLNTYNDGGTKDWSVQTNFNLGTGAIAFWHGGSGQILYDQWVELKYIIDLDNNTVDKYYNGELMATDEWDDNDHGTLGVIDLYGNNASSIYYDDIRLYWPPELVPPPTSNLVAWWKLDEGSGTIAADSSGNGHDGTAQATPEWVDGPSGYGKALYFDGSNPAPAWVNCGTWNPSAGTGQLTVALWVRWDGPVAGVWQGLIAKSDGWGNQGTQMMWDIMINKDSQKISFFRAGSYPPCGGHVLPIRQWSHVAATFDGATMIFYIDGEETGRGDFSFGTKTDSTIIIGANNLNGWGGFHGALDDIRLYNYALSPAEIKGDYGK